MPSKKEQLPKLSQRVHLDSHRVNGSAQLKSGKQNCARSLAINQLASHQTGKLIASLGVLLAPPIVSAERGTLILFVGLEERPESSGTLLLGQFDFLFRW